MKKYTVETAWNDFFQRTISKWSLYEAIKSRSLPHVKVGKRIILDHDTLTRWWAEQEAASVEKLEAAGYGKIRRVL